MLSRCQRSLPQKESYCQALSGMTPKTKLDSTRRNRKGGLGLPPSCLQSSRPWSLTWKEWSVTVHLLADLGDLWGKCEPSHRRRGKCNKYPIESWNQLGKKAKKREQIYVSPDLSHSWEERQTQGEGALSTPKLTRDRGYYVWQTWSFSASTRTGGIPFPLFLLPPHNRCLCLFTPSPLKKPVMHFISLSGPIFIEFVPKFLFYDFIETSQAKVTPEYVKLSGKFFSLYFNLTSSCLDKVSHSHPFRSHFFPCFTFYTYFLDVPSPPQRDSLWPLPFNCFSAVVMFGFLSDFI